MTGDVLRRIRERSKPYMGKTLVADRAGLGWMTVQAIETNGVSWSKKDPRRNAERQAKWRAIIAAIRALREANARWAS